MSKKEDAALSARSRWGVLPQLLCGTAVGLVLGLGPQPGSAQTPSGQVREQRPSAEVQQRSFNIPAQPLTSALTAFGDQAGMQVAVDTAILAGRTSQPVSGRMAPEDALRRLLSGSGIAWRFADPTTLVLSRASGSSDSTITLDPVTVQGRGTTESAYGPVHGFVATRSATGTKADIPLIETPQSISVVTADQVSIQNAESLSQALKYTPGVTALDGDTTTNDGMIIRGFNVTGTALTYLNGTRFSRNIYSGISEPYALERIEVLKGPASVLYGNAAPGGIINMVTKQPLRESFRELSMQLGSFDRKQISGDFTGPLTSDGELTYRVTGLLRRSNTMVDEIPDDRAFGSASIRWQPTDDTSLTFLAGHQNNEVGFHAGLPLQGTILGNVNGKIARDRFVGEPKFNSFKVKNYSVGYLFSHKFSDQITFRQNALYYDAETDWRYMSIGSLDASQRLLSRFPSERHDRNSLWTIDNQLEAKWTVGNTQHTTLIGVDYAENKFSRTQYRGSVASLDIFDPQYGAPVTMVAGTPSMSFKDKDRQLGIYAQEHVKIADRLVVMLGGRYDRAEAKSTNYLTGTSGTTYDEDVFTGRAGLVYLFDNGIAPYASFAQSFQPTAGQTFGGQPYKPSEGEQYELGVRYQPPGQNASVTASVYQLTQTNVFTGDPVNSGFYVQEGEVRSRGFELEGRASLADNLNLIASYSYIDNVVTKSNSGTEGNRFAGVPKHMASLWADYQFSGFLRDLRIGAGVRYFGSSYNLANTAKVPDYVVVDAVIRYDVTPDWSVSLNVNNMFDEEYFTCVNACYYGTERSVFVKTSYRW